MKINTSALTGSGAFEVHSRAMKLLFVATIAKGGDTDPTRLFSTDLVNATIEIEKQTSTAGGYAISPEIKFTDLLEIAAANEGCIDLRTNGSNFELRATVELSDFGAIEIREQEFFKVKFASFGSVQFDVYTVDAHTTSPVHNVLKNFFVNANTPKSLEVPNSRWIAMPDASFKKIDVIDAAGRLVTYEKEELRQVCNEGNEIASNADGKIRPGYHNLLVLNVSDAQRVVITTTSSVNVYTLSYEAM